MCSAMRLRTAVCGTRRVPETAGSAAAALGSAALCRACAGGCAQHVLDHDAAGRAACRRPRRLQPMLGEQAPHRRD